MFRWFKKTKGKRKSKHKSTVGTGYESGPVLKQNPKKELPFKTKEKIPGSPAEVRIHIFLKKHSIKFQQEKKFPDLINPDTGMQLRYDFYLPEQNTIIEYNGKQHYQYHKDYHDPDPEIHMEQLRNSMYRDYLKKAYAFEHDIRLLVLTPDTWFKIEDILKEALNL